MRGSTPSTRTPRCTTSPADPTVLPGKATKPCASGSRRWIAIWEGGRHEPEEFIDAGDFVVVALRIRARRRDIDVPVDVALFQVFEMRDGRIQRGRAYLDKA